MASRQNPRRLDRLPKRTWLDLAKPAGPDLHNKPARLPARALAGDRLDQLVSGGVRIKLTCGDTLCEVIQRRTTAEIPHALAQSTDGECLDLVSGARLTSALQLTRFRCPCGVLVERF